MQGRAVGRRRAPRAVCLRNGATWGAYPPPSRPNAAIGGGSVRGTGDVLPGVRTRAPRATSRVSAGVRLVVAAVERAVLAQHDPARGVADDDRPAVRAARLAFIGQHPLDRVTASAVEAAGAAVPARCQAVPEADVQQATFISMRPKRAFSRRVADRPACWLYRRTWPDGDRASRTLRVPNSASSGAYAESARAPKPPGCAAKSRTPERGTRGM
jgi:hypothetical protein